MLFYHVSFSVKWLFMSFAHFLIELFGFFLLLSFESLLHIIHTSPLSDVWFANIFSWSMACLFILLTGSFAGKHLKFGGSSIYQFSFYGPCFGVKSINTAWALILKIFCFFLKAL